MIVLYHVKQKMQARCFQKSAQLSIVKNLCSGVDFMQIEKFLTVEETAPMIRCSAWHVRYMLRNGILRGVKVSPKAWRVPESAILELIERGSNQQQTAN
jgi:excisionase family DNA binding protein